MADLDSSTGSDEAPAAGNGLHPFKVVCPQCDADSDTQDFELRTAAPAPHADFLLAEIRCESCGAVTDFAVWVPMMQEFLEKSGLSEHPHPQGVALLDRYLGLVAAYRQEWDEQYASCTDPYELNRHEIDLSQTAVEVSDTRLSAIPARVLAAARGLRQAAAALPGETPVGRLTIGPFTCVVSFDESPNAAFPGEVPFLQAEPGQIKPVIHYYLGAHAPELNEC